jgi:alanyl-tRNA synthetase
MLRVKEPGMRHETRRLYHENSYQVEFESRVVERLSREGKPGLVLAQTCFYPESGGQPHDKGLIDGVEVIKVLEEDEKIVHLLEKDILSKRVKGRIDWEARFDHMQQHSGQHILSQSFYELFKAETLSFHLGGTFSTVEIDLREARDEEVENVEKRANEIVFQDREIKSYFVPEEGIRSVPLRKPPQKKGLIRVVEVAGFDYSACGGTHVRRAGEIGIIKILKWERIRNNLRFEFVCGRRAVSDYAWRNRILLELANRFTVQERDILSSVEKNFSDLKSQRKMNRKIQEKIVQYEAQEMIQKAKGKIIKQLYTNRTAEEMKFLALNIIRRGEFVVLLGLKREGRGHLVLASSEKLGLDMRELLPLVFSLIKGKGGGQPSLVEFAGEAGENVDAALAGAYERISEKLDSQSG